MQTENLFRLLTGKYRRFENGRLVHYSPNDTLKLDKEEQRKMRYRIEPVKAKMATGSVDFKPEDVSAMDVSELKTVVASLTAEEAAEAMDHEHAGKDRVTVLRMLEDAANS